VYKVIRITFIAALLLLATIVETQAPVAAAPVTIADGIVEWTTTTGEAATSARPDSDAFFYIKAAALESTAPGTATWSDLNGNGETQDVFSIATGAIDGDLGTVYTLDAAGYDTVTPANTPLTDRADVVVSVGGADFFVLSANKDAGTFQLFGDVSALATPTIAAFKFHKADTWLGTSANDRRAKITSTSDPQGEFVDVSEVTAVGATTSSATSQIFRGLVALSKNAAVQGTNNDGVWVQDGDTLTVAYLKSDGTTLDSDSVTVDGVEPTIGNLSPADGTVTNSLNPSVTFSVTDAGSKIALDSTFRPEISLAINGVDVGLKAVAQFVPVSTEQYDVTFFTGVSWLTSFNVKDSEEFSLTITATDNAGNVATLTGTKANVTIDTEEPKIQSAKTGSANTEITVTFDQAIASVVGADFHVAGIPASAAALDADDKKLVKLTVATLEPDDRPVVMVVGDLVDAAGNAVAKKVEVTASDGIKPGLTITIDKNLAVEGDAVKVTAVTNEKLAVDGLEVSVNGAIVATTAPTPQNNEGTFTVAVGDATGTYGAAIRATDGSNITDNLTAVTDEEISVAVGATVITLGNGPIADKDFDGDVDKADITALVGGSVTSTDAIASIDPSARTITLNDAVVAAATIKVSYHYVATDTFQIDQSAPGVEFEPAAGAKVRNQSPFIRVTFKEDEYPGDTFKTVELTKAVITNPDGTTEDVLAKFFTSDNIEYIWAAANLALGKYKLVVSGKDVALNEAKDQTVEFTIEKKTVTVSLRPGWNLVSIPDSPEDNAINTVITSTDVDVVLTYDPTTPQKWLNATRGADGLLSGTLSTIDASRAYWVHTGAFGNIVTNIGGLAAGQPGLPPSYNLVAGWNLVPVSTPDIDLAQRDADNYLSGLSWSRAYGYNNATNAFEGILPSTTAVVKIGQGYWVFLKAAGTLVP